MTFRKMNVQFFLVPLPISTASVIRAFLVRNEEEQYHVLPASVLSYDATTQEVDLIIAVNDAKRLEDGSMINHDLPTLKSVKVAFPRTKQYLFSFPLTLGDTGIQLISTLDVGGWETTGQVPADPLNLFRNNLSSCVFIPGWLPDTSPPSPVDTAARQAGAVFGVDGGTQIRVSPTEIQLGANAVDYVALSTKVDAQFALVKSLAVTAAALPAPVGTKGDGLATALSAAVFATVASLKVKSE